MLKIINFWKFSNIRNKKNLFYVLLILFASGFLYIISKCCLIKFIIKLLNIKINNPNNFQGYIEKMSLILFVIFPLLLIFFLLRRNEKIKKVLEYVLKLINKIILLINFRILVVLFFIYYIVLMYIGISNYDLGYDEAWYIHWGKNFINNLFPYSTFNEEIDRVDCISMLPYYCLIPLLKFFQIFNYFGVKLLSSLLSTLSLIIIYYVLKKNYNNKIAFFSILFISIQPGFGFVMTSFFGEPLAISLMILAFYFFTNKNSIYLSSILLAVAIHTKFQLIVIIFLLLLISYLLIKDFRFLKLFLFTLIFTCIIFTIRLIPVLIFDYNLFLKTLRSYFGFLVSYHSREGLEFALDKIQLFNRFFPLILFIIICYFSLYYIKSSFDKIIYLLSFIIITYWIFFFNFTTYRHLFMGLVPLSILFVRWIYSLYFEYNNLKIFNIINLKDGILKIFLLFFLFWGFSTNLIYAYIGYNDGVQFDMDGFKSRLFSKIEVDNSQKFFYEEIKKIIFKDDLIFSESPYLTKFHFDNKVYEINKIKEFVSINVNKYVIISRETFLYSPDKEFKKLNDNNIDYNLILKIGDFYLLKTIK